MFLSRVGLDRALARNLYEVHRQLWRLFPGRPDASREFLFRVDWEVQKPMLDILLQSVWEPSAPGDSSLVLLAAKPFNPVFTSGQRLRFLLHANPTKRMKHDRNRVPLIREEDLTAWLSRKLDGAATVVQTDIRHGRPLYFKKGGVAGKVGNVTFSGVLTVTNPEALSSCDRTRDRVRGKFWVRTLVAGFGVIGEHMNPGQMTIYETEDGKVRVEVLFGKENVWLTQKLMARLFECSVDNVGLQ